MYSIIVKHYYFIEDTYIMSDISFDIFKTYKELLESLLDIYQEYTTAHNIEFDESNIKIYRCGCVDSLGEFTIHSNALPIYLKDLKEMYKND